MSHADTIHRKLTQLAVAYPGPQDANEAPAAVDAMEAENQQLRDALERIAANGEAWELPPRGVMSSRTSPTVTLLTCCRRSSTGRSGIMTCSRRLRRTPCVPSSRRMANPSDYVWPKQPGGRSVVTHDTPISNTTARRVSGTGTPHMARHSFASALRELRVDTYSHPDMNKLAERVLAAAGDA